MAADTAGPVLVLGIGNAYRSDDAVGLLVARQVRAAAPPGVTVGEESGEGVALMDAWEGALRVVLCDAVVSGGVPGTIYRLDAQAGPIPTEFFNYSTHAFSVAEAVELARALGRLPPRLIIYGVEGRDFHAGTELSPPVAAAVPELVARILAEARDL
jgi:hydrogenase maturation protease